MWGLIPVDMFLSEWIMEKKETFEVENMDFEGFGDFS